MVIVLVHDLESIPMQTNAHWNPMVEAEWHSKHANVVPRVLARCALVLATPKYLSDLSYFGKRYRRGGTAAK